MRTLSPSDVFEALMATKNLMRGSVFRLSSYEYPWSTRAYDCDVEDRDQQTGGELLTVGEAGC